MTEPRLYMRHVQQLRGRPTCRPGIRAWCRAHNVDLRTFARDGMAGEDALRIGDAFALRVLAIARKEATPHGQ